MQGPLNVKKQFYTVIRLTTENETQINIDVKDFKSDKMTSRIKVNWNYNCSKNFAINH